VSGFPHCGQALGFGSGGTTGAVWTASGGAVAGTGGVTHARQGGAVHLAPSGNGLLVGVFPTEVARGRLTITIPGMAPVSREVEISPAAPFREVIPYAGSVPAQGEVTVAFTHADGRTLVSYRGQAQLRRRSA